MFKLEPLSKEEMARMDEEDKALAGVTSFRAQSYIGAPDHFDYYRGGFSK